MPIQHVAVDCENCCIAHHWTINDIDELADVVGLVIAGASFHAEVVIADIADREPRLGTAIDAAINKLYIPPEIEKEEKQPVWHRDGLLFQAISWVAAHLQKSDTEIIADPHVIKAHKGLDGLLLNFSNDSVCLTIFEDKAGDPDDLIHKIMKEFRDLESDDSYKAEEILQGAVALLKMYKPPGWEDLIYDSFWLKNRNYRASLATLHSHCTEDGAKSLFNNFSKSVQGELTRRLGHVMGTNDVRAFFRSFAALVITKLNERKASEAVA